ncbi:polymer-forming cytoskeletal protein [Litchfieldella xinjiangensis]|uniref:polymer-forming cytoskeletal protein n=1 Tax=Litchfieldella xinjiangensis TaxID=1166948 RepID=UPI0005B9A0DB|nr:polymer-forming cytoskeletal protein [Halomonas xinjiangensis]
MRPCAIPTQPPRRQAGAALIVTLVLLVTTTLLALTSYQSSLLNERMAGNYRASLIALNEAEAGVAGFYRALQNPENTDNPLTYKNNRGYAAREKLLDDLKKGKLSGTVSLAPINNGPAKIFPHLEPFDPDSEAISLEGDAFWLVSEGRYGPEGSEAIRRIRALFTVPQSTSYPFGGIITCEGATLGGSGLIDSYDSRLGAYGANQNAARSNVTVASQVIRDDPTDDSVISLNGNAPIYGNIKAPGNIVTQGSSAIIGNIDAMGRVDIRGGNWWNSQTQQNGRVFGDIRAIGSVNSNVTLHGNVDSQERIMLDWGAKITGNATAPYIELPNHANASDFVEGTRQATSGTTPDFSDIELVTSAAECATLDVDERVQTLGDVVSSSGTLSLNGGGRDVVLNASGLHDPNGGPDVSVANHTLDGREVSVVRFDSFSMGGSPRFIIGEPNRPVDMVMVVDGNTDIGGGGSFTISPGSTLQIVTSGQFNLGSGITVGDGKPSKVTDEGSVPILSVVSNYRDANSNGYGHSGVRIGGGAAFYGQVIAPYALVDVHGSGGMYGAVNAGKVDISGAGGFHYDESFNDITIHNPSNRAESFNLLTINETY